MSHKTLALLLFETSILAAIMFVLLFTWCYFTYWRKR